MLVSLHIKSCRCLSQSNRNFRELVVHYWPTPQITAAQIQSLYEASKQAILRPFLKTSLGGLAPETRQQVYRNLLAEPSPFAGWDYRALSTITLQRPPISLATFVDLKASCLTVLQACRQIYLEAFPIFYACKSYYLAKFQDLATFCKLGRDLRVGPRLFQVDTITSLCLKDLVINRQKWKPQQIEELMSRCPTFNREQLEAARTNEIDCDHVLVDLEDMISLRKICLCMRVGQEWEHLEFLFNIGGLRRGVMRFVDDFHWTISSQNGLGDDWNIQYAAFPNTFYRRGKNFELLDYHDVSIQGEVLKIDSRASDLVADDERWVEVNIGSCDFEEGVPDWDPPDVVPGQVSENQQALRGGQTVDLSSDDGSDHGSENLQGSVDWGEDGTQTDNEPDQESGYLRGQSEGEKDTIQIDNEQDQESEDLQRQPDGVEDGVQIDIEQDQEPMDLQEQPDGKNDGAKMDDEPGQESGYPQKIADGDEHNSQAESDANWESRLLQEPSSEDHTGASTEIVPKKESEGLQSPLNIKIHSPSTATESQQGLEASGELVDGKFAYVQAGTGSFQTPAIVSEVGDKDSLEARPAERTQVTTEHSSVFQYRCHYDAQTQTVPVDTEHCNAGTQTKPVDFAEDLRGESQMATVPSQNDVTSGKRAVYQPRLQDGHIQPKSKRIEKPHDSEKSAKPLQKTKKFPILLQSSPDPGNSAIPEKSKTHIATVDKSSTPKAKRQSLPTPHPKHSLNGCVRAAALMLAPALLYVVLYAKLENTLGQLLALLLFVLLFFVALWSESD